MTTTVGQAVAKKEEAAAPAVSPRQALEQMLNRNAGAVGASLPSGYSQERFMRLLLTAANTNPDLFTCEPRSFLAAGVGAAQLGLEPNDARGLAYLIPFRDNRAGKMKVQLIIGYRGMLDLARRSGLVSSINAFPVFKGDRFEYQFGLEPSLVHVPAEDGDEKPEDLTHVYAVAKVNGDPQFVVLTRKQIDKVKAGSQGAKSRYSPWNSGFYVEMALKTALRRLCKWLPQTVELAHAAAADEHDLSLDSGVFAGGSTIDPDDADIVDVDSDEVDPETGEFTSPADTDPTTTQGATS